MGRVIEELSNEGIAINVTAVFTPHQVRRIAASLAPAAAAIVSVFAGRVADTGIDPVPLMRESAQILAERPNAELLWASPRELLNIFEADAIGCHIITVTHDLLKKLPVIGRDLTEYSLDTVKMFFEDARAAGFTLNTGVHA
jgi:transaldolase